MYLLKRTNKLLIIVMKRILDDCTFTHGGNISLSNGFHDGFLMLSIYIFINR